MRVVSFVGLSCVLAVTPLSVAYAAVPTGVTIESADEAYRERAREIDDDRRVSPEPIATAIRTLEDLLAERPDELDVQWRLVRALYFSGDHSNESEDQRLQRLERAREVGDAAMQQIAILYGDGERLEDLTPEEIRERVPADRRQMVAGLYYWTAVAAGSWSQLTGILSAVTDGVANKLYRFSGVVIALEPGYDKGGAHRLRSYLHATVPYIPFVAGWISKDLAVPEAEAAMAIDPDYRGNEVIYALALLETRPNEEARAKEILKRVARLELREEPRAEDVSIRALALEKLGAGVTLAEGIAPEAVPHPATVAKRAAGDAAASR